jgi:hypothetical protein
MTRYTISVGLFDKDTHMQEISTIDAYKIMTRLVMKHSDGGTITEGTGLYTHKDGSVVIEPTLIVSLLFVDRETILILIDEIKNLFNQETVALEEMEINSQLV